MEQISKLVALVLQKDKERKKILSFIPENSICVEIGIWKGDFSQIILDEIKPKKLILIDPWKFILEHKERWHGGTIAKSQADMDDINKDVVKKFSKYNNVEIIRDFSESAIKKFKSNYFDFVYIDGDHSYEFVKKDLEMFVTKTKKGGIIAGDDYLSVSSVVQGFPVKRAVDEFIENNEGVELLNTRTQFVIRKK